MPGHEDHRPRHAPVACRRPSSVSLTTRGVQRAKDGERSKRRYPNVRTLTDDDDEYFSKNSIGCGDRARDLVQSHGAISRAQNGWFLPNSWPVFTRVSHQFRIPGVPVQVDSCGLGGSEDSPRRCLRGDEGLPPTGKACRIGKKAL